MFVVVRKNRGSCVETLRPGDKTYLRFRDGVVVVQLRARLAKTPVFDQSNVTTKMSNGSKILLNLKLRDDIMQLCMDLTKV